MNINQKHPFIQYLIFIVFSLLFIFSCNTPKKRNKPSIRNEKLVYVDIKGRKMNTVGTLKLLESEAEALTKHWEKYPRLSDILDGKSQYLEVWIGNNKPYVEYMDIIIPRNTKNVDLSLLKSLKYLKKLKINAPIDDISNLTNLQHLDSLFLVSAKIEHLILPENLKNLKDLFILWSGIERISLPNGNNWDLLSLRASKVKKLQSDTLKHLQTLTLGEVDTLNIGLFPNIETCRAICKNIKADTLKKLQYLEVGEIKNINLDLFPSLKEFSAESKYLDTTYLKQKYPHIEMTFYRIID